MDLSGLGRRQTLVPRSRERLLAWSKDPSLTESSRAIFGKVAHGARIYTLTTHRKLLRRLASARDGRHAERILLDVLEKAPANAG